MMEENEASNKMSVYTYKCEKCGAVKRNIAAKDDNMDKIIALSSNPIIRKM